MIRRNYYYYADLNVCEVCVRCGFFSSLLLCFIAAVFQ